MRFWLEQAKRERRELLRFLAAEAQAAISEPSRKLIERELDPPLSRC
jgi:hypothetical protein